MLGKHFTTPRFEAKFLRLGPDECWFWIGASHGQGYGTYNAGSTVLAHRIALSWRLGRDLEPSECACHSCDNPSCVNPDHLWPGSNADNVADRLRKGRLAGAPGESNRNARLTEAQVEEIRACVSRGEMQTIVAARFGVGKRHVNAIVRGRARGRVAP